MSQSDERPLENVSGKLLPDHTAVTITAVAYPSPTELAAADSGTAKPDTGVFFANSTSEAHGIRPVFLAIAIVLLAAEVRGVSIESCQIQFFLM